MKRRVFEVEFVADADGIWLIYEMNIDHFPRGLVVASGYILQGLYHGRKIGCRSNYSRKGYDSVESFLHYHFGKRIEVRHRQSQESAA